MQSSYGSPGLYAPAFGEYIPANNSEDSGIYRGGGVTVERLNYHAVSQLRGECSSTLGGHGTPVKGKDT